MLSCSRSHPSGEWDTPDEGCALQQPPGLGGGHIHDSCALSPQVLTLTMMSMRTSGLVTAIVGWVATIIICALPMWRVTTCSGSTTMAPQSYSDGLWVTCAYDASGQSQCRSYNSLLEITPDLQVARVMVVTALITAFASILISVVGRDFASCMGGIDKNGYTAVSGALFFAAGVLVLVPVAWTTSNIVNNFYTPMSAEAVSRELGAALYIGWIAIVLLLSGGIILSRLGTQSQQDSYVKSYRGVKTCGPTGYPMKDYV
ncbi:claudin-4-like [Empidonax traillii]|uniref:claudin-4-like n=1 Tax=Empidonax traillii TaxID=164674 RepID=UPI000FFDBD4F|nr:claudin-4-like [Empidonax traillii]